MKKIISILTVGLLLGGSLGICQGQPNSPAGITWDCLLNGKEQEGIAFILFLEDATFTGYELLVPKPPPGSTGRTSGGRTNSPSISRTNLFGAVSFDGQWRFDNQGRIIGNFVRNTRSGPQSVSFIGKVTASGKRLTLLSSTQNGNISYRGIVAQPLPDLSGSWSGFKKENSQSFLEFFDLTASSTIPFQNSYDMDGTGAGYSTSGVCLVSAQKRIGFALNELPDDSTNLVLRATMGSFINSKNKIGANTRGFKAPDLYINFSAQKF